MDSSKMAVLAERQCSPWPGLLAWQSMVLSGSSPNLLCHRDGRAATSLGPCPVNAPETSSQQQFHSLSACPWSATHCTQITGIQVLWPPNTELTEWGVCLNYGFKNLWQEVLVCGWRANGTTYWLQSAGWLADFCQASLAESKLP